MISDKEALINNIFYHSSIKTDSAGANELLSVTIVKKHGLTSDELRSQVEKELKLFCNVEVLRLIKHYSIPKALPNLQNLKYEMTPLQTQLSPRIFLAGDVQLNASLNAAIIAGEKAALGVVEAIIENEPQ